MQAFIGIIATIATVIHLTVGCCAHACPLLTPSVVIATAESTVPSSKCCRCQQRRALVPEARAKAADSTTGSIASERQTCHECHSCVCAATPLQYVSVPDGQLLTVWIATLQQTIVGETLDSVDLHGPPDPWGGSGLRRHSLFERFLN